MYIMSDLIVILIYFFHHMDKLVLSLFAILLNVPLLLINLYCFDFSFELVVLYD